MTENPLVEGIISDAKARASAMVEQARKDASAIESDGHRRADKERESQQKMFSLKLEQVRLKEESSVKSLERTAELKMLDVSFSKVMDRVSQKIEALVADPAFSDVIIDWIAEAAIGLYRSEAVVSYSAAFPVTEAMLEKARVVVKEKSGLDVKLVLGTSDLRDAGVVLSSADGSVSYNNQLNVRMRRYQRDIRRIIQEEYARQNSR